MLASIPIKRSGKDIPAFTTKPPGENGIGLIPRYMISFQGEWWRNNSKTKKEPVQNLQSGFPWRNDAMCFPWCVISPDTSSQSDITMFLSRLQPIF